jgi:hypothetical protein
VATSTDAEGRSNNRGAGARARVLGAWLDRALPWLAVLLPAALLARAAIGGIVRKLGHPGATLDDAYIHFQYARAIAEGHPFRYFAGDPPTSGATSLAWPLLLAPFWLAGARGESLLWVAWGFSFAALALLAREAYLLAEPLTGRDCALGCSAMVLAFPAFTWCAASGMEVVPFAWLLARSARRASDWVERGPKGRTRALFWELVALAWVTTLMRPEGALAALGIAAAIAFEPARPDAAERLRATLPFGAALFPSLLLWILTGQARSSTAQVKLLFGNPYYPPPILWETIRHNIRLLFRTLLNGEVWSVEFLPTGLAPVMALGLASIPLQGWRRHRAFRSGAVLLFALGLLVPCTYVTFLWNRLRYLWPFAPGLLVGLACMARIVGDLAGWLRPRAGVLGPMVTAAFVGAFAMRFDWVLEDVAQSASGIDRQQIALGRWARANLPADARIGVNDTGAIAYFGERRTFDVVGLTTATEPRYWIAGAGSRLEHYERMHRESAALLPTHFIVYPEWMACDAVLGEQLHEATVLDATILGGKTMSVHVADWSALGSGEQPWSEGAIVDALDVADLESETEHGYELLGARDGTQVAMSGFSPEGVRVIDGGRTHRTRDRFLLRPGARLVARLASESGASLEVLAGGAAFPIEVAAGEWQELSVDLPATADGGPTTFEVVARRGIFTSFHYWTVR